MNDKIIAVIVFVLFVAGFFSIYFITKKQCNCNPCTDCTTLKQYQIGDKIMNHTKFNIHDPVHFSRPGTFSGHPAENMIINGHICGNDDTKSPPTYNITIDGVTMTGVHTTKDGKPFIGIWEFFRGDGKDQKGDPNIGWDTDWFGGCRVLPSESSDPGMTDIGINDITNIPESSLTYGWVTLADLGLKPT